MIPVPLNDNVRRSTFWISTLGLIAANVWVFLEELSLGPIALNRLIVLYGIIPARYTTAHGLATLSPAGFLVPVFTSMFIHGGWLHLAGNMLFLFVFGRSIEDRFGHFTFLMIYFVSGLGAALLHIALNVGSRVPTIGASGAIAGILGAYFVTFPRARITTLIIFFWFWRVDLPALLVLGYWFLIQFFSGFFQILMVESVSQTGGVAVWAHVGGFVIGALLALIMSSRPRMYVPRPTSA